MEFSRRGILRGLIAAPLVVVTPGLLMPVKAMELDLAGYAIIIFDGGYVDPGHSGIDFPELNRAPGTYSRPANILAMKLGTNTESIYAVKKNGRWVQRDLPIEDNSHLPTKDENYDRYEAAYKTIQADLRNAPAGWSPRLLPTSEAWTIAKRIHNT